MGGERVETRYIQLFLRSCAMMRTREMSVGSRSMVLQKVFFRWVAMRTCLCGGQWGRQSPRRAESLHGGWALGGNFLFGKGGEGRSHMDPWLRFTSLLRIRTCIVLEARGPKFRCHRAPLFQEALVSRGSFLLFQWLAATWQSWMFLANGHITASDASFF